MKLQNALIVTALLLLAGCDKNPETDAGYPPAKTAPATKAGTGNTVHEITPNVGGITPVAGGESVGGAGGGGIGDSAKGMARRAAATEQSGSAGTAAQGDGN